MWASDQREWKFSFAVPDEETFRKFPNKEFAVIPDRCYLTYVRTEITKEEWRLDCWNAVIVTRHGRISSYFDLLSFDRAMQWFQMSIEREGIKNE